MEKSTPTLPPIDKKALARRILDLEHEIVAWRTTNSQSNPGAVMELRAMKKELEKLNQVWKALNVKPSA